MQFFGLFLRKSRGLFQHKKYYEMKTIKDMLKPGWRQREKEYLILKNNLTQDAENLKIYSHHQSIWFGVLLWYVKYYSYGCTIKKGIGTLYHLKSLIESAILPIRLFLKIIMMPLKRCVGKEKYLIALLRNDARNNFLMSGPLLSISKLQSLLFSTPRWRCCYLIFSSCNVKFPR